jgi:hypothetical protein
VNDDKENQFDQSKAQAHVRFAKTAYSSVSEENANDVNASDYESDGQNDEDDEELDYEV